MAQENIHRSGSTKPRHSAAATFPPEINWKADNIHVHISIDSDGVPHLSCIVPPGCNNSKNPSSKHFASCDLPLGQVRFVGEGNSISKSSKTLIGSYVSARLRYVSHAKTKDDLQQSLDITCHDETSGILVTTHFVVFTGISVLRSWTTVTNTSKKDAILSQVNSLTLGGLSSSEEWWNDYTLSTATNTWFREAQWHDHPLPTIGLDNNGIYKLHDGHVASMANFSLSNRGSFSTGTHLPMGMLKKNDKTDTWLWQVENNASWRWEIGDYKDNVYLAAGGPTSIDHDWRQTLTPGETFTSVPMAVCHVLGSPETAFGMLTQYRRRLRRKHADNDELPIIFKDYMNCLMGDPTEDKIKSLLPAVAGCGAEYFVIDAGWYADDNGWWDDVGLWEPSKVRFPSGFKHLLDTIRSHGMIPGLWLEPEVIGVWSIVASQLPPDVFFQERGERIVEKGRYQLDYSHKAVRERMDKIVDNLVLNYGVGYFKFDYNIEVVQGTDVNSCSTGAGQLGHSRAYLHWVNKIYDRHPFLVIESCSSGAQRMDYAMLAVHSLQSTSDQQDPVRYAAIAAAAPTAVTPEQSATWAYPQPSWDLEMNALTVVNSLLGRVHLSGKLDELDAENLSLVKQGMDLYKSIRSEIKTALPLWALGLPKWHDEWVVLGMAAESGNIYLSVWRLGGHASATLPIANLAGKMDIDVDLLYPGGFSADVKWDAKSSSLVVELPSAPSARLFRLRSK
ncbi:glycoside hydrolase family 36 protein [Hyaloscypha hepaticicola]|uniref:alpha-galactosidase n=1 Tax=Hyaloscypha hepaticicola TaxID=2082293 RepID=A0A2J6PSA0_9HELO|nr:glycoside hydrolase family 36 protein [Hyaloscypha hepaticicola]